MPKSRSRKTDENTATSRPRSVALVTTLWLFGLATSMFLIGMWGRTVAVDSATIEGSARTIIDSEVAEDRINAWFEEGLAAASDVDSETSRSIAQSVETRPEYRDAVDTIIAAFLDGLFVAEGEPAAVDIDGALDPLVPVIAFEFAQRDVPIEVDRIEQVLDDAGVVALDTGEAASMAAVVGDARAVLTQVVVVALMALAITGAVALFLSRDRFAMVRQLASRVVLAALSYAVILRFASWALDPNRGRSPVAGGLAVVLRSNAQVFVLAAVVAGSVSASGAIIAWRRRTLRKVDSGDAIEEGTKELVAV